MRTSNNVVENETSNPMSSKVLMSYTELKEIRGIILRLSKDLKKVQENPSMDISDCIGKYAREMPRAKVFVEQMDYLKTQIRKICTRETSIDVAIKKLDEYYVSVNKTLELYNQPLADNKLSKNTEE